MLERWLYTRQNKSKVSEQGIVKPESDNVITGPIQLHGADGDTLEISLDAFSLDEEDDDLYDIGLANDIASGTDTVTSAQIERQRRLAAGEVVALGIIAHARKVVDSRPREARRVISAVGSISAMGCGGCGGHGTASKSIKDHSKCEICDCGGHVKRGSCEKCGKSKS